MTPTATIDRILPQGPADTGLQTWEAMDPATLVSGAPVQRGHITHERPEDGYMTGVWDCTAFTEQMGPYPVDEVMLLLQGELFLDLPDGTTVALRARDVFVIPKGLRCQWRQPGYLHKVFMILDGPVPEAGRSAALNRVTVPDLTMPAWSGLSHRRTDFVNAAGTVHVGVEAHTAMHLPQYPVAGDMAIHVLAGALTLGDGIREHAFAPGETGYVQGGGVVSWQTAGQTRLLIWEYRRPA